MKTARALALLALISATGCSTMKSLATYPYEDSEYTRQIDYESVQAEQAGYLPRYYMTPKK